MFGRKRRKIRELRALLTGQERLAGDVARAQDETIADLRAQRDAYQLAGVKALEMFEDAKRSRDAALRYIQSDEQAQTVADLRAERDSLAAQLTRAVDQLELRVRTDG